MKKLAAILISLCLLIAIAYALMQGEIGKNFVKNSLMRSLESSGYRVQIERIEGTLPHQVNLKGVDIQGHGAHIAIQELRLRPILWRLFKKELAFQSIQAKGIVVGQYAPFDLRDGKLLLNRRRLLIKGDVGLWACRLRYRFASEQLHFSAVNDLAQLKVNGKLSPQLTAHIDIRSDLLRVSGNMRQEASTYVGEAVWDAGFLSGTANAAYREGTLKAAIHAEPFATAHCDLRIGSYIQGTSEIDIHNFQALHIPDLYGKLYAKATWDVQDTTQTVQLEALGSDLYYQQLFTQTLNLTADVTDPLGAYSALVDVQAENLKWKLLEAADLHLEAAGHLKNGSYRLSMDGDLRHPFELSTNGAWDSSSLAIQQLQGIFLLSPFSLQEPLSISYAKGKWRIPDARLNVGDGLLFLNLEETSAQLQLTQFPLDLFSWNPLEVSVGGTVDFEADVKEVNGMLQGSFSTRIDQTAPLSTTGEFTGKIRKDQLLLQGELNLCDHPLLQCDLTIPLRLSLWPMKAEIQGYHPMKGHLSVHGDVEEILDYFDLGPHRLEGGLSADLSFGNTFYHPYVTGTITFEEGRYENYYSGTELSHLHGTIVAEKNVLYLREFHGQDRPGTGTLQATGKVHLSKADFYPFEFDTDIMNLQFTEIDLVKANAEGHVRLEGNTLSALATGDIHIHQCDLTIPDHIPHPLPHLDVVYHNAIHPIELPQKMYKPYPLRLDLHIKAPANITIEGRGLESRWTGDFHLGGTLTSLATQGKLELVEGDFKFSSRTFKLTEGSLAFSGVEHQMPYLNLAAEMETKGILITARLKGALNDPQLTLLSNPPLPLSSIMSYLLFGQELSEISGFQALQLASSLASLAGTGPDVMEATRKSLGVDRLNVVSVPTEDGETVSLQVGKYISKGVLVSYSQGPDENSSNVSVEIELKNNFVFQIENDQRQEQGKFTLKWNLNY